MLQRRGLLPDAPRKVTPRKHPFNPGPPATSLCQGRDWLDPALQTPYFGRWIAQPIVSRRLCRLEKREAMFLAIFVFLLLLWLLGWAAFHVAGGVIHLLLILAIVALIVHFFRGRRAV